MVLDDAKVKTSAAVASIGVNVFLLALKGTVGVITGSVALWASFADSLLDLTASCFALVGVKVGARPPDVTHAYGHAKFESLSSLVQLALLFVTVGVIATQAVERLRTGAEVSAETWGVAVIAVSLVVDLWISRRLTNAAAASGGSHALEADALHFRTDVWSNLAVIAGLIAAAAGLPVADPIAALVVALFVAVTAVGLLRSTAGVLTDHAPDEDTVRAIAETLSSFPEVEDVHTLRARMVGSRIFLDVCVELDPDLTFKRAHDLTHEMQDRLRSRVTDIADAVIHFEPAGHPEHQDTQHHAHGMDALAVDEP